jgi:hypothetical protein
MELQDLITLLLLLACVWTFIPRHVRLAVRSGLSPSVAALAESLRIGTRIAANALTHLAYRGLLGVPIPIIEPPDAPESEPARSVEIPPPAAVEPHANGSQNPSELALNADEVAAVARMIEHNKTAAKPSKSSTIRAGFGLSRGGGSKYQRASAIYDALFGPPAPAVQYRELTPDRKAALN